MRSSLLIASAFVADALARPHNNPHPRKYRIHTKIEIEVVTVVVTITAGPDLTSSTSSAYSSSAAPSLEVKPSQPSPEPSPAAEAKPTSSARTSPPAPSSTTPSPQPSAPSSDHISGPNQAYLSSGPDYQAAVLYHHNAARANHDASPLTWDDACEKNARIAAQKCTFEHFIPQGAGQGQNLFTVSGKAFNATAGITESWYKSELPPMMPYFGRQDIPDEVFHGVGHLTQMVWKGTTKVGCVSIDCGDKMVVGGSISSMNKYTVCNYAPAGNIGGRYAENVVAPISTTNLGGWAD
ncbi:CAP domain-containing protein [Paraphoma chrysanthemicola]|uniref:CAP domain-containing protein n=1 Tax=Paraphoma chrysanthemicola TaxID=798071 RepID=A0A8K0W0M4_9PLEO|nr:CAP domain-containing protein [Paraphoma chrysanthemicola]